MSDCHSISHIIYLFYMDVNVELSLDGSPSAPAWCLISVLQFCGSTLATDMLLRVAFTATSLNQTDSGVCADQRPAGGGNGERWKTGEEEWRRAGGGEGFGTWLQITQRSEGGNPCLPLLLPPSPLTRQKCADKRDFWRENVGGIAVDMGQMERKMLRSRCGKKRKEKKLPLLQSALLNISQCSIGHHLDRKTAQFYTAQ